MRNDSFTKFNREVELISDCIVIVALASLNPVIGQALGMLLVPICLIIVGVILHGESLKNGISKHFSNIKQRFSKLLGGSK